MAKNDGGPAFTKEELDELQREVREAAHIIAKIKRRDFGLEWPVRRDDEQHPPSPEPVEPA